MPTPRDSGRGQRGRSGLDVSAGRVYSVIQRARRIRESDLRADVHIRDLLRRYTAYGWERYGTRLISSQCYRGQPSRGGSRG